MFRGITGMAAVVSVVLICLAIPESVEGDPTRDEERIVYEYGFEDGWNGWEPQDPWEISDEEAHNGEFSAHCPIEENLNTPLISPSMEIPGDDWHTYFEFWVRADTRMYDSDGDNMLDDYFRLEISVNGGGWEDVIYDYGRDDEWMFNWMYYGPGVWFRLDMPEWRVQLDLSQFAGDEVRLIWLFRTDDVMDGDQGTGLWIDDFRMITTDTRQNDVGVKWVYFDYPTSMGTSFSGTIEVANFGYADQEAIRKFVGIEDDRGIPVVPWDGLEGQTSRIYEIVRFREDNVPHTGMAQVKSYAYIEDDEYRANDTAYAEIFVYPENVWKLGYDGRNWTDDIIVPDDGPAVLFTPEEDGIDGDFNIYAIEALWSDAQQNDEVTTTLTISEDQNGRPGEELYSVEIAVTPEMLSPRFHYIDLSEMEQLRNISGDFWVSFTNDRQDHLPHVIGRVIDEDDPYWGEGHYYSCDGDIVREVDMEYQIHAILIPREINDVNLIVQPELRFGQVAIEGMKAVPLVISGGSTEPVVIEDIETGSDIYNIVLDRELPFSLSIGETAAISVEFRPEDEGNYETELTFECNDESSPVVTISGTGSLLPAIEVFPLEVNFGEVELEDVSERVFTILNLGLADLVVTDIDAVGDYFEVEFEDELVLRPDDEIDIFAAFCPLETGRFDGEIIISSNDPNHPRLSIPATGFGVGDGFPVVERPIRDLLLDEDFDPVDVVDLDDVFVDLEGDDMTFDVESDDQNLLVELDDDNHLWLSTTPNWFGNAMVTVFADDHVDEEVLGGIQQVYLVDAFYTITAYHQLAQFQHPDFGENVPERDHVTEHTFIVIVQPVNDPPENFNLLLPEDGFRIDRQNYLTTFEWEEAVDIDDNVEYRIRFYVNHDGIDTTVTYYRIEQTMYNVGLDQMLLNVGIYSDDQDTSLAVDWWVEAFDGDVTVESEQHRTIVIPEPSSVRSVDGATPQEYSLSPAFPNPFNAETSIPFAVPFRSKVTIRIHDLSGGIIQTLSDEVKPAGRYLINWDGRSIPAGVYLVRMASNDFQDVKKLVLVR